MLKAFRNAFLIPDLRAKLLVTIGLLGVYRLLVHIPTPGIDLELLKSGMATQGDIVSLLHFLSGGNFETFSIAALGVLPYTAASIILPLFTQTYPPLQKLQKEGEERRKNITMYTRV